MFPFSDQHQNNLDKSNKPLDQTEKMYDNNLKQHSQKSVINQLYLLESVRRKCKHCRLYAIIWRITPIQKGQILVLKMRKTNNNQKRCISVNLTIRLILKISFFHNIFI